jgi:dihydroorotate dehydrogenase (fumarate)
MSSRLVRHARDCLSIPVITSFNGATPGGWVHYAKLLADAGADAIELNLYGVVVDPRLSAADVEARYVALVDSMRAEIAVPLAVKIGPWFTALPHFACALPDHWPPAAGCTTARTHSNCCSPAHTWP